MLAFPCGDCRDSEAEAERASNESRGCASTHMRRQPSGASIWKRGINYGRKFQEVDHHKSVFISRAADEYIMKEGVGNVVFDFEDTRFMDSSGIGIIIGRYKKISYFGGKVFAINTDARIKRTMMICGLHKVIEIME